MTFLSSLGAKIGLGLSGVLLIVCGVLWALLAGEQRHSAKLATRLAQTQAAFDATVADYRAKAELARLQDAENKARVEAAQSKRTLDDEKVIRARVALELERVRKQSKAHSGRSGKAPVSGPSNAPSDPFGAGQAPELDDKLICTENTVKLEAWWDWFKAMQAIRR